MPPARLEIPPCPVGDVLALQRELGVSFAVGQVLVRRGLADPAAARAWLEAREVHDPSAFAGIADAVALVLDHLGRGSRITVHGDYDVDGVCSTAILVRALRTLAAAGAGGAVDWYLPSRGEDGYGLSAATVARLAARGTGLLITADCAITAVEEVAAARAAGMDVVVTDHHAPRADGARPAAPIVHPGVCGYPCPDLCATGVAHKLVAALLHAAGHARGAEAEAGDLGLVALATVADCVPLRGENRRLVRAGLQALRTTRSPGLRALMRVARVDPGALDARAIGFRLAPRINAAGRMHRADAGLELLLTEDGDRAAAIAEELDAANTERRHVETRILFEAEAQAAQSAEAPAFVLAGEGWHPGVIGIVASRIAERHHRPCVLVALDGEEGTGSGRSIPAFDLLAGLDDCAPHLLRHGGHRAAAGCTVARAAVDDLRAAFVAHAGAVLGEDDLVPRERVDAVVGGDELGLELAEELERLAPFGVGNPDVALLVPAARLADPQPMGEGRHVRFTVESGGVRARAVAFGIGRLPAGHEGPLDATFALERNEWNGAVEPRLVLRCAQPPEPPRIALVGEPEDALAAALTEFAAPLPPPPEDQGGAGQPRSPAKGERPERGPGRHDARSAAPGGAGPRSVPRDRRGAGVAATIAALVASGDPVLVVCADARRRRRHLAGRLGGFGLCSWLALERDPGLAAGSAHVVALDPPAHAGQEALLGATAATVHLAWGENEARFALAAAEHAFTLRAPATTLFRALRDGAVLGAAIDQIGDPALAGRALRALAEIGLVAVDPEAHTAALISAGRTALERSPTHRAAAARLAAARVRLAARVAARPAAA